MLYIRKKLCVILMISTILVSSLSGCGNNNKTPENKSVLVMTVNDSKIYLDEVLYQVWKSELENLDYCSSYEKEYGEDYWDSEIVDGVTVRESLKDELYDTIVRESILYDKAINSGYTLTDKEKKTCEQDASDTLETMGEDEKEIIGADLSFMKKMEEKETLVSKYFDDILASFQVDRDEAAKDIDKADYTQYDIQTIGFSKIDYDTDGTETKKSAELDEMGLESLKEVSTDAKKAENLQDVLDESDGTLESEDYSFTPGDGSCETEIEEVVKSMDVGDTSDIIETDKGYYIVRLTGNTSSESYEDAVDSAVKQAEYEQFDNYYEQLESSASIETTQKWEEIVIGGTVVKEQQASE